MARELKFYQRVYTVLELRTGFVAGTAALLGASYGAYLNQKIAIIPLILMIISAFSFNIVANIANEIRGVVYGEENQTTITGHFGSEGLVRQDAKLQDAIIALIVMSLIGIVSGLVLVLITKDIRILIIGIIGFMAAILYSLTKFAYIKLPVGEVVSGLMCGFLCVIAAILTQGVTISLSSIALGLISYFMVSFLMSANNTVDYYKDLNKRVTLSHILGFRRAITILIPQIIIVYLLWIYVGITTLPLIILIVGLLILTYFGIIKWYYPYWQLKTYREGIAREFGPKPLILIITFNVIISMLLLLGAIW